MSKKAIHTVLLLFVSAMVFVSSILLPSKITYASNVFVQIEPVVLGIYTQDHDVSFFVSLKQADIVFQDIEFTFQYSNLSFKNCFPGNVYDSNEPECEIKEDNNKVTIHVNKVGRVHSKTNSNVVFVMTFAAKQKGNARFWLTSGHIYDLNNQSIPYQFLPFSIQIQEPRHLRLRLQIGEKHYWVNDERFDFAVKPLLIQDRTFVPLRSIAEKMGAEVKWLPQTQVIEMEYKNVTIEMKISRLQVVINGKSRYLDVPPVLFKDKTIVPLRFVAETLGGIVSWDSLTSSILIDC